MHDLPTDVPSLLPPGDQGLALDGFGPFVLFSERGDLRLTEPEAPQVPGLGAAATLLLVSLLAASAGPLARKRFVGP